MSRAILFAAVSLLSQIVFAEIKNASPGHGTIAVMGDSLARGRGAENDSSHAPEGCLKTGFQAETVKVARDGATTSAILAQIDEVEAAQPRLIFVSSGGNDAIRNLAAPGIYPEERTLEESAKLFDRLLGTGALVVYLGLNPPLRGGERLPKVWRLAESKGVLVVDGMSGLWFNRAKMADAIHPNEEGYAEMCARIVAAVAPYFP